MICAGVRAVRRTSLTGFVLFALSTSGEIAQAADIEVYQCDPLVGKSAMIRSESPDWVEDAYGRTAVVITNDRFFLVGGDVPPDLEGSVADGGSHRDIVVISRDEEHLMGVRIASGSANAYLFHRPSKRLAETSLSINRMAWTALGMREGFAGAFITQCR